MKSLMILTLATIGIILSVSACFAENYATRRAELFVHTPMRQTADSYMERRMPSVHGSSNGQGDHGCHGGHGGHH